MMIGIGVVYGIVKLGIGIVGVGIFCFDFIMKVGFVNNDIIVLK